MLQFVVSTLKMLHSIVSTLKNVTVYHVRLRKMLQSDLVPPIIDLNYPALALHTRLSVIIKPPYLKRGFNYISSPEIKPP